VAAIVAAKSGQEMAICASLAAQLAGASAEQIERCAALGLALGTAGQLASDCHDVFSSPHSKDLAAGTRTLPIVLALNRLEGSARADFLALLERARHDEAAREAVRRHLHAAGVVRPCALTIEVYRQRALRLLDSLGAREPARGRLQALIQPVCWPHRAAPAP
jgi:heptaprenyl diphosphate synthase